MFGRKSDQGYTQFLEGIRIKTIAHGRDTLMTEFLLEKGAQLPQHAPRAGTDGLPGQRPHQAV